MDIICNIHGTWMFLNSLHQQFKCIDHEDSSIPFLNNGNYRLPKEGKFTNNFMYKNM